ncbi:MAG: PAS domain-containing protein [Deltaproteobacteria bacterium]
MGHFKSFTPTRIGYYAVTWIIFWSLILFASFWLFEKQHQKEILETARTVALAHARKDALLSTWVSGLEGIYGPDSTVPHSGEARSEDLISAHSGQSLALLSPSGLFKQLDATSAGDLKIQESICSLHPQRPENRPDDWEKKALLHLQESGASEFSELTAIQGNLCLRLMMPLAGKGHAFQPNEEIRRKEPTSGISIILPLAPFEKGAQYSRRIIWCDLLILWGLGLFGIGLSYYGLRQHLDKRRQAEERLRAQRNLLDTILTSTEDLIALKSLDFVYIAANPSLCAFYGKSEKEILGHTDFDLFPLEEAEQRREADQAVLAAGRPARQDMEVETVDGLRWLQVSRIPVCDETGKPVALLCSVHDTTERKRTEEALRKYEQIVSASQEHMAFADRNYVYQAVNDSHLRDFKKKREEIVGRSMADLLGQRLFEKEIKEKVDRALAGETIHFETWCVLPGMGRRCQEVTYYPFFDKDRSISGVVIYVRDITDRKQVEERLRRAQKLEAIGTLAGGIAHDFNNILQPIIGYAQLSLKDLPKGNEHWENLQEIVKAVRRAADLIKQILTFSRQAEQERSPSQLQPLIKEVAKSLRAFLPSTIEIREEVDPSCRQIHADLTQIHQVLMNLATNAYHAMRRDGGVLTIGLDEEMELPGEINPGGVKTGYARLTVTDTGHGMTREIQDRVFDPYFTTKGQGEGTGLGLATVHGIVEAHGGKIIVQSAPGEGTRFEIYLPLVSAEGIKEKEQERIGLLPHDAHILFVDDEAPIAELGCKLLERLGCQVTAVNDSRDAWQAFAARPDAFHVVVTDQIMPHLTGTELARRILDQRPELPIILVTGFAELLDEEQAQSMGIQEILMKPVATGELVAALARALGSHSLGTPTI